MRDHRDGRVRRLVFLGTKRATERGTRTQHVEVVRRDQHTGDRARLRQLQGHALEGHGRHVAHARESRAKRGEVVHRIQRVPRRPSVGQAPHLQVEQPILMCDARVVLEHPCVDECIGHHRRGHADREAADDRNREAGRSTHGPHRVARVACERVERRAHARVPRILAHLRQPADGRERRAPRFARRHARRDPVVDVVLDERLEFGVERAIARPSTDPPAEHRGEARYMSAHAPSSTRAIATVMTLQCSCSFASCFRPALVIV